MNLLFNRKPKDNDNDAVSIEQPKKKVRGKPFARGDDPRRHITGRPKLGNTLAARYRDALAEAESEARGGDYTNLDAMIDILIGKAMEGDQRAIEYLQERGFGKVPDRLELSKEHEGERVKFDMSALTHDELYYANYLHEKINPEVQRWAHEPVEWDMTTSPRKYYRITLTRVEIGKEEYEYAQKLSTDRVNRNMQAGRSRDVVDTPALPDIVEGTVSE